MYLMDSLKMENSMVKGPILLGLLARDFMGYIRQDLKMDQGNCI